MSASHLLSLLQMDRDLRLHLLCSRSRLQPQWGAIIAVCGFFVLIVYVTCNRGSFDTREYVTRIPFTSKQQLAADILGLHGVDSWSTQSTETYCARWTRCRVFLQCHWSSWKLCSGSLSRGKRYVAWHCQIVLWGMHITVVATRRVKVGLRLLCSCRGKRLTRWVLRWWTRTHTADWWPCREWELSRTMRKSGKKVWVRLKKCRRFGHCLGTVQFTSSPGPQNSKFETIFIDMSSHKFSSHLLLFLYRTVTLFVRIYHNRRWSLGERLTRSVFCKLWYWNSAWFAILFVRCHRRSSKHWLVQVAIVGIGGVGSVAAEMLTRCGIGKLLMYGEFKFFHSLCLSLSCKPIDWSPWNIENCGVDTNSALVL